MSLSTDRNDVMIEMSKIYATNGFHPKQFDSVVQK